MRARALPRRGSPAGPSPWRGPRLSVAQLYFLRGRDADARLRALAAARAAARPVLGALAAEVVDKKLSDALGYRSLGDWCRERLGLGSRALRDWARVARALRELPLLQEALRRGEVSWSVADRVVGLVTPETEAACLETVRGRTVRAVEAIVRAVRRAEAEAVESASAKAGLEVGEPVEARGASAAAAEAGGEAGPGAEARGAAAGLEAAEAEAAEGEEERVTVRLACTPKLAGFWSVAVEFARRMAGEELPVWACAERIAAEAASAIGAADPDPSLASSLEELGGTGASAEPGGAASPERSERRGEPPEHGLRERAFPGLRWSSFAGRIPQEIEALVRELPACPPREIERRLRAAIAFLQGVDFETGRILRQMRERGLLAEIGFESLERYARERLDLSPRTARRLVALSRAEHRAPAVATAFQAGELPAFHAQAVASVADLDSARAWVERARAVTLRRLEDELAFRPRREIVFHAPPEVARFFLSMLVRAGSLERLLAHAIRTWVEQGEHFEDYADFERDGFRCTVPGCTGRRNLHSHHIRFKGVGGPDVPENRTTLCACHHERALHAQGSVRGALLRIRGRAPHGLRFELGHDRGERFVSGDVRLA
jgi:hypothetical protein